MMKAAVLFGIDDLRVIEKEIPKIKDVNDILIKVRACAICGSDLNIIKSPWAGAPPFGDYIPGHEYAGEVAEVGRNVTEFKKGDRVVTQVHKGCMCCDNCIKGQYTSCLNYGDTGKGHRTYGITVNGGFAEYAVNHSTTLYKLPDNIDFPAATIVTTAGTALFAMDLAGSFITGEKIIVFGPGPIGLMLVQLLKAYGASNVILIGTRDSRLELGKKLGADFTIMYKGKKLIENLLELNNGNMFDLVFDCAGAEQAVNVGLSILKKNGKLILVGFYKEKITLDLNKLAMDSISIIGVRGEGNRSCGRIIELAGQNKIDLSSIITHEFNLNDINHAMSVYKKRFQDAIKVVIRI